MVPGRRHTGRGVPLNSRLPEDAELFSDGDSWAVYYSRSDQSFLVQSTDCHPRPFRLTRDEMMLMVNRIRGDNPDQSGEE